LAALLLAAHAAVPLHAGAIFPVATNAALLEFSGGLAFDGTNYLVGFLSGTNLIGQRISTNGLLLAPTIAVGANPGFPPAVALADGGGVCLAAWSDTTLSSGVTVFGQLGSPSTGLIGSPFPLLASAGSHGVQRVRAAASDGVDFLVVWQDAANGAYYGQFVTRAGARNGDAFLVGSPAGSADITVAYGATNYLVACQTGAAENENHVYCLPVFPNGTVGSAVAINATASLDHNPLALAFDGTAFLVVWNHDTSLDPAGWPQWTLQARRVAPDGAPLGNAMEVMTGSQASFPALAFDGDNYLLAWGYDTVTTNADTTIRARFLDPLGNAIGPALTPFPPMGSTRPLLPCNGVLFDGSRFLLAATYGSFVLDAGEVVGFSGGDVYATTLPRSQQQPFFTDLRSSNGQFQCQLHLVPGQAYTIEVASNLPAWTPAGIVSSAETNVLTLVDASGTPATGRKFYRAVIGNSMEARYGFRIHEFAAAGSFSGSATPTLSCPVTLQSYAAIFDVENELLPPPAGNVAFTGPSGSGLTNAAGNADNSSVETDGACYQSPSVSDPTAAPAGTWVVHYKGTNHTFTLADPQAAARLFLPVPTVSVAGDTVLQVSWTYRDAATGEPLASAPAHATDIQLQIDSTVGGRIYNSPVLATSVTNHTLTSDVSWANVCAVHLAYDDSLTNHYVIRYAKP